MDGDAIMGCDAMDCDAMDCDAIMIHGWIADWSRQSWGNINTAMDV